MDQKSSKPILVAAIAVVLVGAVIVLIVARRPSAPDSGEEINLNAALSEEVSEDASSRTRAAVPANVAVPEKDAITDQGVAVPSYVSAANQTGSGSFRGFEIQVNGGKFIPDTVIVKQGDTAHMSFIATDQDYDVTQPDYGFKVNIPKGQAKLIEFSATANGKFTFFCASCGGPERGPVGYLIVAQ